MRLCVNVNVHLICKLIRHRWASQITYARLTSSTKKRPQQFVQSVYDLKFLVHIWWLPSPTRPSLYHLEWGIAGTSFSSSSSCSPLPCPLHLSVIALLRSRLLLAWPLSLWSTSLISVSHRSSSSSQWLGPSFLFFFFICLPLRLLHSSSTPSTQQPSSSPLPCLCAVCVCDLANAGRKEGQNDWGARLRHCMQMFGSSGQITGWPWKPRSFACPMEFRWLLIRLSHKSLSNLVCRLDNTCASPSLSLLCSALSLYHLLVLWSGVSGLLQNRWGDEGVWGVKENGRGPAAQCRSLLLSAPPSIARSFSSSVCAFYLCPVSSPGHRHPSSRSLERWERLENRAKQSPAPQPLLFLLLTTWLTDWLGDWVCL